MKSLFRVALCACLVFAVSSCTVTKTTKTTTKTTPAKKVPPGQAKKAAGTQSAKPFAPGQQKKKP